MSMSLPCFVSTTSMIPNSAIVGHPTNVFSSLEMPCLA